MTKSEKSEEKYMKNLTSSVISILVSARNGSQAKIGQLEISIAEEPNDEPAKDRWRRDISRLRQRIEYTQQLIDHINKFEVNGQPVRYKKSYKSLLRARGFCILMMQDKGYLPKHLEKTELMLKTGEIFPDQSKQKMYLQLKIDPCLTLADKVKYPADYEYGLTLFKLKTGK